MVILEINLVVKEGQNSELKRKFNESFGTAIIHQSGFYNAYLLEHFEDKKDCTIILFFDTEEKRIEWVNSDDHDPAWESIVALLDSFSVKSYKIVDKVR